MMVSSESESSTPFIGFFGDSFYSSFQSSPSKVLTLISSVKCSSSEAGG